ncbi:cob(I)yrinic acid a,c-diamide adenosyltransferase [Selenomonas timonae]|uniref:Cob(I)yrinic acid a,c-diamide adenosyltransferase n=1 Tax=Selenomonas timonae TaxID=2754044 RepID=A0A7G7VIU1_9FIRM|nr:cob(I)yrinic acid a,c-diamide adenosyltransferase [Selenomonas timonae]QNH54034.1 cob(I)yrinic acid a,c-diamide adenosyltransferase [Selenomonas timonae]
MIQVYTGNGKGKTTAAIGLAIRALGAGHKAFLMQFMKSLAYSEQHILQKMPNLTLETTGKPFFIAEEGMMDERAREALGADVVIFPKGHPPDDYVALLTSGLDRVMDVISKGETNLIILDEINIALSFGLLRREQMEEILHALPSEMELVCTGRNAPQWLLDRADLITEMREVRHYYERGISARRGIEN